MGQIRAVIRIRQQLPAERISAEMGS